MLETNVTYVVAAVVFAVVLVRQSIRRPVTRKDFILPALGGLYLAIRYLPDPHSVGAIVVQTSATIGILSGLMTGGLVRVWPDEKTGLAYQFGGWRFAGVIVALLVVRIVWHLFEGLTGLSTGAAILNDSLTAAVLGNYFGRGLHVGVRAIHLVGWNPRAIPTKRAAREIRAGRPK